MIKVGRRISQLVALNEDKSVFATHLGRGHFGNGVGLSLDVC
jgi:hypothetical protein